ncbi:MAG: hypothetical protein AAF330_01710 [Pseudomonadota bacterium]
MSHVAIVIPLFEPDLDYLDAQLASLAAQAHADFSLVAVIADLTSTQAFSKRADDLGLNHECVFPSRRLRPTDAYEFGLKKALKLHPKTEFFALCDQDDIWHADRLSVGIVKLAAGRADLVHSDASVICADGSERAASLFALERRPKHQSLRDLLRRNTVTGMTALMRRAVIEAAVPFPRQSGTRFYHDYWLALVAKSMGGVTFHNAPLVAYRLHSGNCVGPVMAMRKLPQFSLTAMKQTARAYALAQYLGQNLRTRGLNPSGLGRYGKPTDWALLHLFDVARSLCRGSPTSAWKALQHASVAMGGLAWTAAHFLKTGLRTSYHSFRRRLFLAGLGLDIEANKPSDGQGQAPRKQHWSLFADRRTALRWTPKLVTAEPRFVFLVPTLNTNEIYAGITTIIDIVAELLRQGARVKVISTDAPIISLHEARAHFLRKLGPAPMLDGLEIECGVTQSEIDISPRDVLVATAWWTAYLARDIGQICALDMRKFIYIIQDFEPAFYAWGSEYMRSRATYEFDFIPLVNSLPLYQFFFGNRVMIEDGIVFRPSVDFAALQSAFARDNRQGRKQLLFYGRPNVDRNMFGTGVEAIAHFIRENALTARDIKVVSAGFRHPNIRLPNHLIMTSLGKLSWEDYLSELRQSDMGLSLMYSPHPSHLPLEMAAAGVPVVTNRFAEKDLSTISPLLRSVAPDAASIATALTQTYFAPPQEMPQQPPSLDISSLGAPLEEAVTTLLKRVERERSTTALLKRSA